VPTAPFGDSSDEIPISALADHERGAVIFIALEMADRSEELLVPCANQHSSSIL
jgi:hypothetical protein